jgi:hypothetical protein
MSLQWRKFHLVAILANRKIASAPDNGAGEAGRRRTTHHDASN